MKYLLFLHFLILNSSFAASAPGHPGIIPTWSSAKKVQVGTSVHDFKSNPESLVWYSLATGVLTETYFPTIDKAQIKDSQFLVKTSTGELIDEKKSMTHEVVVESPQLVTLVNKDKKSRFEIAHTFYTSQNKSILFEKVTVKSNVDGLDFFVLTNTALNNSGLHDSARTKNNKIEFYENETRLRLSSSTGFKKVSVGYVGYSDGYQQLTRGSLKHYSEAIDGNVAGTGQINIPNKAGEYTFYLVYEFLDNKEASFYSGNFQYELEKTQFIRQWDDYFSTLKNPKNTEDRSLYYRSMYVLRVHEDKLNPGAMIASLSVPWGEEIQHSEGLNYGGYHLIWPRDLFHVSLAALYSGDRDVALRALRYLKRIQYKSGQWNYGERVIPKLGAFPQNVWTDGKEYWGGLQLDQVAYPVQLFYHVYKLSSKEEQKSLKEEFKEMNVLALDFIQRFGPWTGQERWEENFGISPSSFSAAALALILGTEVYQNNDWKNLAMKWLHRPGDNIHNWTFTQNGVYGDGEYYVRIGGCENYLSSWNPNEYQSCIIANSGERMGQTEILDQGFLKLVLFGLVKPNDHRVEKSLEKINQHISVKTPKGIGYYRYTNDAYGEDKKGRLWPLLNSEHGRYYIENLAYDKNAMKKAIYFKETYKGFKNAGDLIPEQIFESSGEGTGGATPLAWGHAEFIKLMWSIDWKKNIANPGIFKR